MSVHVAFVAFPDFDRVVNRSRNDIVADLQVLRITASSSRNRIDHIMKIIVFDLPV
jgi:hypothetical protein